VSSTDHPLTGGPAAVAPHQHRASAAGDRASAPPSPLGFLIVLGSAALFGMLGPLARFAYDAGLQPAAFVAWRALLALLVLLLVIGWRVRFGSATLLAFRSMGRRAQVTLLVAAVTGFTLNLCMFIAFDRITIALALLGFYTYPAMIAVVNVVLGREPLDRTRVVALGLALLGMTAVVASQIDPTAGIRLDALGIGLALGAAVSQTIYVVVSRDGYPEVPTEQAIAIVVAVTVVGASLMALLSGSAATLVQPLLDPDVLPLLVFTGVFAAAIPSLGFLWGIRAIGGLRAGILMLFEPVVGVALAAWLLSETLAPIQIVGAIAILAAAVILQRASRSADPDDAAVAIPGGH
jgi:drug/metabolite transporter (DMT)-like permease